MQLVFSFVAPDDLLGTVVALSVALRMMGQVVGKSMYYAIFYSKLSREAPTLFAPAALYAGITSSTEIKELILTLTAGPLKLYVSEFPQIDTQEKYDAIVSAGKVLFISALRLLDKVSIAFGGFTILACLALFGIHRFIDDRVLVHL